MKAKRDIRQIVISLEEGILLDGMIDFFESVKVLITD